MEEDIYSIGGKTYSLPKGTDPSVLDEFMPNDYGSAAQTAAPVHGSQENGNDIYEINGERYSLPKGTDPSVLDEFYNSPNQTNEAQQWGEFSGKSSSRRG